MALLIIIGRTGLLGVSNFKSPNGDYASMYHCMIGY